MEGHIHSSIRQGAPTLTAPADEGEAGMVGQGLEQVVAHVLAQREAVRDYRHQLALRAAVLVDKRLAVGCAFPGCAIVLTAVSDARAVLGAKGVAGLQIGSGVSVTGGVSLMREIFVKELWA